MCAIITVPVKKTVTMEVANGELKISKIDDSYHLEYHNRIYKNSPFKLPMSFSTSFTLEQVINSHEVQGYLARFN